MKLQHTPGPWFMDTSLHIYGTAKPKPIEGFPGGKMIDQPHVCTAKHHDDATLIAAAPELLLALDAAEAWVAQYLMLKNHEPAAQCMLNIIRPALAKARGEA